MTLRRGLALGAARATSAWTSSKSERFPSSAGTTLDPGVSALRSASSAALASGTASKPVSTIRKSPSSSVEPNRFLTERRTRYPEWRSPSSDSTVSTMCSSSRGPASAPSFVTCPTRNVGTDRSFASRSSRAAQSRTWLTLPAGVFSSGEYMA